MAKTTKLPRLTETSDGGCVEIADGISLAWSRKGDLWSIRAVGCADGDAQQI